MKKFNAKTPRNKGAMGKLCVYALLRFCVKN